MRLARVNSALLLLFGALLTCLLWPAWIHNPDLSHGIFMPAICVFLLYQSRREGPARWLRPGTSARLAGILAAAGLITLVLAGLYAAVLDWSHALVCFLLASSFAAFLGAGIAAGADERVRRVPWNWTSVAAAALWPLCSPIPPGTYTRLTSLLQLWVSSRVVEALHFLGVAAFRAGNIIELAHTRVGVEEACSGVRSLVSCVFAGLFFSAALVRRPWRRAFIIVVSPLLALGANFIRSLDLTLMADRGMRIDGFWHDFTGYAVLGLTTVILAGLAVWGANSERGGSQAFVSELPPTAKRVGGNALHLLSGGLALAAVLVALFVLNTRSFSANRPTPAPNLLAILPNCAPGWRVSTTGDLYQFQDILQTNHLAQRYYRRGAGPEAVEIILYVAYWAPGQAPVSLVAMHTPDACWPGTGWTMQPASTPAGPLAVQGHALPGAESRLFVNSGYPQYVWFWHLYEHRPIAYQNPYSLKELLSIAWHYGFRHNGDQLFVRVSSNRPWTDIASEPLLKDFFAGLRPLGLGSGT